MNNNLQSLADNLMGYCQKELGFKEPPSLFFEEDPQNAEDTLGKTAYYEPAAKKVVIYVTGRHNKDILRSIAHELIHHAQNLRGEFDNDHDTSPGYAQKDSHMRNMEKEAYLLGNLLFRDWEDGLKSKRMQENKEINPVSDNIKELIKNALLNEAFGLSSKDKMDAAVEKEAEYNKRIDMKKNPPDPRTHLNKYGDPINPDGSPRLHSKSHGVENEEDYFYSEEELEELEEGEERKRADNEPPHPYDPGQYHGQDRDSTGKKIKKEVHNMNIDTIKEMIKEKLLEALKNEAAKPDFPDIDGDGDREEPISKAAKDKKGKVDEEQEIFAPNHYCVHHGGVQHNGSVQMAEAVSHNYNKELGRVTHYDMKLEDGTILERVAAEDIQVTNASLANEHMHAVRDDDEEEKKMQEADLDEMHCGKRDEENLEEDWGGSSRATDRGGYGWDRGSSGNESKCAAEAQRRTGTNHGPAYTRAKNDCLSRGRHYSNFEESNLEEIMSQDEIPRDAGESLADAERRAKDQRDSAERRKKKRNPVPTKEGKIQTPEQEKLLYESRFTGRDTDLFNRLVNKWIK